MNTTSLFNFEFVDRYKERKIFSNYISTCINEQILWISGERGVGKTRFLKEMLQDLSNYKIIWVDNQVQNSTDNAMEAFLDKLQSNSETTFYDFFRENRNVFFNTSKEMLDTVLADRNKFIVKISDILFSAASKKLDSVLSKNIYQTLISYINKLACKKPLFIVFDNFSRYDNSSVQIFLDLIRNYLSSNIVRFCIITTNEDFNDKEDLENQIYMNIPFKSIFIKEFPSYIFFAEILHKIFEDVVFTHQEIKYIYEKCDGNPENLIKIIKKSLKRNAISIHQEKAFINKEILYTILRKETTHFSSEDFNFKEQLILLVIICIGKVINAELLKLIVDFLSGKMFMFKQFSDSVFFETLGQLINQHILIYSANDLLEFEHDSLYYDISDILYDLKLKPQICLYLYEFIKQNNMSSYGYSPENYDYFASYYAAEAQIPGWENINLEYAKCLIYKNLFHEATLILDKLPINIFIRDYKQFFEIIYTYYEDGQFQRSFNLLNEINIDGILDQDILYKYYFILGKVENILLKKDNAILHFTKALTFVNPGTSKYVGTLNLLHLTYMEVKNGAKKAKQIFDYIKENFKTIAPLEWAKTIRGIANFYDGNNALNLLDEALKIAEQEKDIIESAFIENTIGFINLRNGKVDMAIKQFCKSYENLQSYKIHETSYALNNRAICYMMKGNYEEALDDLLNALIWNSTPYAQYTINCHLCICYLFLKRIKEAEHIITKLTNYLFTEKIVDNVVNRKLRMTLGIAHYHMNNIIESNSFFDSLTLEEISGTSSEYRYNKYKKLINSSQHCGNPYYEILTFEPWILIYGHD